MNKAIGLWIDHRETIIVMLSDKGEETRRLDSAAAEHIQYVIVAQSDLAEAVRERRFTNPRTNYFDAVIAHIREPDTILIFGPGEATVEFKDRLEIEGLGGRIIGIETVDKMTDRQIAAKVRQCLLI
jgi:hypothetical protein